MGGGAPSQQLSESEQKIAQLQQLISVLKPVCRVQVTNDHRPRGCVSPMPLVELPAANPRTFGIYWE